MIALDAWHWIILMILSIQLVDYKATSELGFKPGCFRWHNVAAVSNVNQLFHGYRIKGEGDFHLSAVYPFLQFFQASDATNKVNACTAPEVFDAQHRLKDLI